MSGPPDKIDSLAQLLVGLAMLIALANGIFMLFAPMEWYYFVPTIIATGPANMHFIADIGIAYLSCAVLLAFALPNLHMRWLAALAGSVWLAAHGVLHIYELAVGICSPDRFLQDAPGVLGPPLMVIVAVILLLSRQRITPAGLPNGLFLKAISKLAPDESAYLDKLARAPGHPLEKFKHFMPVSGHRHSAPAGPLNAARIGAALVEDCGPCVMIAARQALAEGLSADTVNAALSGGGALSDADKLGFRFGQAIASRSSETDELGDAIEEQFGAVTRLELALAAATVRTYPALKRGLGLAKACSLTPLSV
jgi:hypothetical protein